MREHGAGLSPRRIGTWGAVLGASFAAMLCAGCDDGGGEASGTPGGSGGSGGGSAAPSCPDERIEAIGPINAVSKGEVTVLSETDGVKTLYIDASAGGVQEKANNPWVYVSFEKAARVDLTDTQAETSLDWDLALKRPEIRTNGGDGGPGDGGAAFFKDQAWDAVTPEKAAAASFKVESWFNAACVLQKDPGGYIATSFDGWYDYGGQDTHAVTPHPGVFVVRGPKGSLYKIELQSFYASPDGSEGMASGRFRLRYAAVSP